MSGAKTVTGISLLIISGVEFLTIKDNFHLPKSNVLLLTIEGIFFITVVTGVLLIVRGFQHKGNNG